MRTTDCDREVLAAMDHTPGTVRTAEERFAFEHYWDDLVAAAQARQTEESHD